MAWTSALLRAVADGTEEEAVRVFRPGPTVAFGRLDRLRPGFDAACRAARRHVRVPVVREGGGRAAAYDEGCVLVEVIRRGTSVVGGLEERFVDLAELAEDALRTLGVAIVRGPLPGEYCPGRFSLHLPGGPKIAGVAQRVLTGASLTTAVLVVDGGAELRAVIADVYAALELDVDPRTAGALTDHHPDLTTAEVAESLRRAAADRYAAHLPGPHPGGVRPGWSGRSRDLNAS